MIISNLKNNPFAFTVMISLILLKAFLMTRDEGTKFLSRGYQIVVKDGKSAL